MERKCNVTAYITKALLSGEAIRTLVSTILKSKENAVRGKSNVTTYLSNWQTALLKSNPVWSGFTVTPFKYC